MDPENAGQDWSYYFVPQGGQEGMVNLELPQMYPYLTPGINQSLNQQHGSVAPSPAFSNALDRQQYYGSASAYSHQPVFVPKIHSLPQAPYGYIPQTSIPSIAPHPALGAPKQRHSIPAPTFMPSHGGIPGSHIGAPAASPSPINGVPPHIDQQSHVIRQYFNHPHHQHHPHHRHQASAGGITKFGNVATGPRPLPVRNPPEVRRPELLHPQPTRPQPIRTGPLRSKPPQPETKQPETKLPEATEPEITKPEVEQPVVKQPQVEQTKADQSDDDEEIVIPIPDLPYNMGYIWAECRRMSADEKKRNAKKAKEEAARKAQEQTTVISVSPELPQEQPTHINPALLVKDVQPTAQPAQPTPIPQPVQPTQLTRLTQPTQPAQPTQPTQAPQPMQAAPYPQATSYNQIAIHIGTISHDRYVFDVFATKKQHGQSIEFRLAPCGATLAEIRRGPVTRFEKIDRNPYFKNLGRDETIIWVKHILSMVPGRNDELIRWS
ncbi:hypothetical protein F4805DRAFT_290926 [Annulohypoxylon moriforme]|nr:hypothetical protein F4805DRAFT_290926 [Annulohypoxylon moriforme]